MGAGNEIVWTQEVYRTSRVEGREINEHFNKTHDILENKNYKINSKVKKKNNTHNLFSQINNM